MCNACELPHFSSYKMNFFSPPKKKIQKSPCILYPKYLGLDRPKSVVASTRVIPKYQYFTQKWNTYAYISLDGLQVEISVTDY